jgi:hypothetical protein
MITDGSKEIADKEVYETSFGDVVGKYDLEEHKTTARKSNIKRKESPSTTVETSATPKPTEPLILASTMTTNNNQDSKHKKANNSNSSDSSMTPTNSETSKQEQARASAREERVRRRQAKIVVKHVKRASSNSKHSLANNNNKLGSKQLHHKSADCVIVPMLTGTLYLYHGLTRRAEFVRKV